MIRWISISLWLGLVQAAGYQPPSIEGVALEAPPPPPFSVRVGKVVLDLAISPEGRVDRVEPLLGQPPFIQNLADSAGKWTFRPARDEEGSAVASRVSVIGVYRARRIYSFPGTVDEFDPAGVDVPDRGPLPVRLTDPGYPPESLAEGVVVLELRIDSSGVVEDSRIVRNVSSLGEVALGAALSWEFVPAERDGQPVDGVVVVLISFLRPSIGAAPAHAEGGRS